MESWRLVLTQGFFPSWSTEALEAALVLLETDSAKLTQGSTTTPLPLMCVQDWVVEAADIVTFCATPNIFDGTVGTAEEGFAKAVFDSDSRLGEQGASRWFLNAYDNTPRREMWANLIEEFKAEIARRTKLPSDLATALKRNPKNTILRGACYDWLVENGAEPEYAKRESGWSNG